MRFLLSLLLAAAFVHPAFCDQAKLHKDALLLAKQFSNMESMQAVFSQQIIDEKGEVLQQASGSVIVKRPRQFYWRTEQPYQHLVVADGKTIWIYDQDLEQVTRQAFTADLDRAPALILSGDIESLIDQYEISSITSGENVQFTLVPRKGDNVFRKLLLTFFAGKITTMTMEDSFQQTTAITFSQVEYNPAIDSGLFHFIPPEGMDVIDNEP